MHQNCDSVPKQTPTSGNDDLNNTLHSGCLNTKHVRLHNNQKTGKEMMTGAPSQRERERDRETERQRERQTDRQTES